MDYEEILFSRNRSVGYLTLNNCSEDAQNGITAFLEKTPPEWRNR